MEKLPIELLNDIAGYLGLRDKKSFRLTSPKLCNASTQALFHTLSLYPNETMSRVKAFENIAATPLAKHVYRIRFHSQELSTPHSSKHSSASDTGNHRVDDGGQHGGHSRDLPFFSVLWDTLRALKFPSLTSVSLNFDRRWWIPDDYWDAYAIENDNLYDSKLPRESFEARTKVLKNLLCYLTSGNVQSVRHLTIKNLQNTNDPDVVDREHFKLLLGRLSSLRLFILAKPEDPGFELVNVNRMYHMHKFFNELRPVWIEPAKSQLTRLTLYAENVWGFVPKVDFRGLHLPRLRVLELGKWCISHDWQIDWIISHAATLEALRMDACVILIQARSFIQLDDEGYPRYSTSRMTHPIVLPDQPLGFYEYDRRWAHVFDRFKTELLVLENFWFGSTLWHNPGNEGLEEVLRQFPNDSQFSEDSIDVRWYLSFRYGEGSQPWIPELEEDHDRPGCGTNLRAPSDLSFLKDDQEALISLLSKIRQRNSRCHDPTNTQILHDFSYDS